MKPVPKNQNEITEENYYSSEIGRKYLSVHALMTYLDDPSRFWLKAHDKLQGTSSPSAKAGQVFHAFVNDKEDFDNRMIEHGLDMFKLGRKKKDVVDVLDMVYDDPSQLTPKSDYQSVWTFIVKYWDKRHEFWEEKDHFKELILTGRIGGVPFKGRLDVLKVEKDHAYIYDYKTIGLKQSYGYWKDPETRQFYPKTFVQEYNYDLQMTAYAELVKQNFPNVKNVYVIFGLLIKSGKHDFVEYPTSFINTEPVNVKSFNVPRFDGQTPKEILMHNSKLAYDLLQLDEETFNKRFDNQLFTEMIMQTGKSLPIETFKLK